MTDSSPAPTLSPLQEGLWFTYDTDRTNPTYNVSFAARVMSDVDFPALKRAWTALTLAHAQLRTTFHKSGASVAPRVEPKCTAEMATIDASTWTEERLATSVVDRHRRPFDLARSGSRAFFYKSPGPGGVLLLSTHLIAADVTSFDVLLDELGRLYQADLAKTAPGIHAPERSYADFVVQQRERITAMEDGAAQFWSTKLAGLEALDIVKERAERPSPSTMRSAFATFSIDAELAAKLRAIHPNLFRPLLAAYAVMLHRFRREPRPGAWDTAIGVMADARPEGFRDVVGSFVNAIPVRARLTESLGFRELVTLVENEVRAVLPQRDFPFPTLLRRVRVRGGGVTPVFQAAISYHSARTRRAKDLTAAFIRDAAWSGHLGPLELQPYAVPQREALYPLQLRAAELPDGSIAAELQGDSDFFDGSTIEAMRVQLIAILADAASRPDARVVELGAPTEAARQRIATWSSAPRVDGDDARTANDDELAAQATRLGAWLRAQGVGAESCVAVSVARGASLVLALRGVLASGGAYVVFDPAWPAARREAVRAAAKPVVELDDATLARALSTPASTGGAASTSADADATVSPDHPACMHFASMTTAVVVSRAALSASVRAFQHVLGLRAGEVVVSALPHGTGAELLAATSAGARVELASDDDLAATIERSGATVALATAATWSALVARGFAAHPGLRAFAFGTPAPARVRDALAETCASFGTLFGTVETGLATASAASPGAPASIGKPVPGARVYVLDASLAPVAAGVPGALYIGGDGVAQRYLDRPELTDARFVADPFARAPGAGAGASGDTGARMFRTGDAARWLGDGSVDVVGRLDLHVDIGGLRIDLEEIEAALGRHKGVREAAVVAREDVPGHPGEIALVAYIAGDAFADDDVRATLAETLPALMIPKVLVAIDALPRGADGSIDRRALPRPLPRATAEGKREGGDVEQAIEQIWMELLRVPAPALTDNFFDLGGHSLLATQIATRISEKLGVEMPIRTIFDAPTIAELGQRVRALKAQSGGGASAAAPVKDAGPPPLQRTELAATDATSFVQDAIVEWESKRPASATFTTPLRVRLRGPLDVAALREAIRQLVTRQETLRLAFVIDGAKRERRLLPVESYVLHTSRLGSEEEVDAFCDLEANAAFALDGTPLIRFFLLERAPDEHVMVLTWHQLVHDATNRDKVTAELLELYSGVVEHRPPKLPPVKFRYVDFAVWERAWFAGKGRAQVEAAKKLIAGARPLELAERPRQGPVSTAYLAKWFRVEEEGTRRFEKTCQRLSATTYMGFAAVVGLLLSRWSGSEDITFMSPVSTRGRQPDLDATMGRFFNWVPLRLSLAGTSTFGELVTRARNAVLDGQANDLAPGPLVFDSVDIFDHPLNRVLLNTPMIGGKYVALPVVFGALTATDEIIRDRSGARNDLAIVLQTADGTLMGGMRAAADLYEEPTIDAKVAELRRLISSAEATTRLADL